MAELFSSDDCFADTRMSFGDHLEDLRRHLWRAVAGTFAIILLSFLLDGLGYLTGSPIGIGKPVSDFIAAPVERQLQDFHDRRAQRAVSKLEADAAVAPELDASRDVLLDLDLDQLARELAPRMGRQGTPPPAVCQEPAFVPLRARIPPVTWSLALADSQRLLRQRPQLKTMSITEGMMVWFQVTLVSSLVLSSPWVFWQLWSFIACGLYPHERRPVRVYLPASLGLFLAGVFVCQFLVMPQTIEALLWFNDWLDYDPDLRLSEWLSFAVLMPLVFGVSFQTPLALLFLEQLGILSVETLRQKRRVAWISLLVFAAVVTPSTDYLSLMALWLPLTLLYELGIVLCRWSARPREEPDGWAEA